MWRECCDICEGYCVGKGKIQRLLLSYTVLSCISTVYVLDCVSLISYFSEMFYDIQYICASPLLSGGFAWPWCVESPICMRVGCGESAAVALAAEMFSFF